MPCCFCRQVMIEFFEKDTKITPEVLLPTIVSSYIDETHMTYCLKTEVAYETLSVLNLTKMNTFISEFNSYVSKVGADYSQYEIAFKNAFNEFGNGTYGLVDFKDYMNNLSTQFTAVSNVDVLTALDNLILSNYYCSRYGTKPCGLNAFFPASATREELQPAKSDYNSELSTKFINYRDMCLLSSNWSW